MSTETLLAKIATVAQLAQSSKLGRLLNNPFKYAYAIVFKSFVYPLKQKEIEVNCKLFTGRTVQVLLPAATDIYLTGGKTHDSELKLAKFLIKNIKYGDVFWDIGAHYGYFSLIAAELVGTSGQIMAVEAAPKTFKILDKNLQSLTNATALHNALSSKNQHITFYEFPNQYSEYNSTDISQFEQEAWFKNVQVNAINVAGLALDELLQKNNRAPGFIKIDVEGGELEVIESGNTLLQQYAPTIIMEFLEPKRNNQAHVLAAQLLAKMGYVAYVINADGDISPTDNIEAHLAANKLDSDNIVFKKG